MNVSTGHLICLKEGESIPAGYDLVPPEFSAAAELVLRDEQTAHVSKHSGGKLSKWAASQRKARRKMAAKSRRRNRAA